MLPLDPDADASRRAWMPCPECRHGDGCPECEGGRNCSTHWLYLIASKAKLVTLQCKSCFHLWTADTA